MYQDEPDYEQFFFQRIASLRFQHNISARKLSLSLGMSPSYISHIENKNVFPSMRVFFYICDFLHIAPSEFFDFGISAPAKLQEVVALLKKLDAKQLDLIIALAKELQKKK